MARGITIGDVENKLQHVSNNVVIPVSSGADVPEVVTVGVLKNNFKEEVASQALTNIEIEELLNRNNV